MPRRSGRRRAAPGVSAAPAWLAPTAFCTPEASSEDAAARAEAGVDAGGDAVVEPRRGGAGNDHERLIGERVLAKHIHRLA